MPLLLPKTRGITRQSNISGRLATGSGTAVTSDTVAHQFPATYTQLIASTTYDSDWVNVWLHANGGSNTRTDSLLTIYVGADGSEQPLMPYLLAGWSLDAFQNGLPIKWYGFPLRIPAGSRLSARHQSVRTSQACEVIIELLGGGTSHHWTGTKVEAVGYTTASSSGTTVTPGTTSDGSLTSMGTTVNEWGFVLPMIGGNVLDTTMNAGGHAVDLGSGAATALPGLDEFMFGSSGTEFAWPLCMGRYCALPAGTTLYLRDQFSGTAETTDYVVYGVY